MEHPRFTLSNSELSVDDASDLDESFDPNDPKYRCCCNHSHATTGVRVIAGILCLTVCLEVWHLGLTLYWLPVEGAGGSVLTAVFQLLVGFSIATSVIYALRKEHAAFLIPYLVLQTVGLAAGAVFLVTFIYISLFSKGETVLSFIESHGRNIIVEEPKKTDQGHPDFMSWLLVGSFLVILFLQIWLISIVFACWRYFRDKRAFGSANGGFLSYVVLGSPFGEATRSGPIHSSISADVVTLAERPCRRIKYQIAKSMSSSIVE
ncbi:hypothetical protein L596_007669 [Steinernema carpocapsae]|uniref:Uncharacterized protein n=1 Tax=Steinernema carpocapsae TaxID=34508 RepID=A0A4U5PB25_STECR|nr:hypothetical protein L596_007669 [Steinernema carpocapsae]